MPHVGPVLEGRTFFCPHCGALYFGDAFPAFSKRKQYSKMCRLLKGHGQVGHSRSSDLQAHSST